MDSRNQRADLFSAFAGHQGVNISGVLRPAFGEQCEATSLVSDVSDGSVYPAGIGWSG
jgi:hypothetical protein